MTAAGSFNGVITKTISILGSNLTDPLGTARIGSYFFDSDHEIVFTKYMPKGQVMDDGYTTDNPSFGRVWKKDDTYRIQIHYFVKQDDKDPNTLLKDRAFVRHYIQSIQDTIMTHSGSYGPYAITFDIIEQPIYLPDHKVYVGTLPVIFKTHN